MRLLDFSFQNINMETLPMEPKQPPLFWEGFSQDFEVYLWESVPIWSCTGVEWKDLTHNWLSNSSQWCTVGLRCKGFPVGLRSRLCAGRLSSSTLNWSNHVFLELALYTGAQSCWNILVPKMAPWGWKSTTVYNFACCKITVPFTGNTWTQSIGHIFFSDKVIFDHLDGNFPKQ